MLQENRRAHRPSKETVSVCKCLGNVPRVSYFVLFARSADVRLRSRFASVFFAANDRHLGFSVSPSSWPAWPLGAGRREREAGRGRETDDGRDGTVDELVLADVVMSGTGRPRWQAVPAAVRVWSVCLVSRSSARSRARPPARRRHPPSFRLSASRLLDQIFDKQVNRHCIKPDPESPPRRTLTCLPRLPLPSIQP